MLKKRRLLIVSTLVSVVLLIIVGLVAALSCCEPQFTGAEDIQTEVLSEKFKPDVKAKVEFLWFTIDIKVKTSGEIDNKKIGEYTLTHTSSYFFKDLSTPHRPKSEPKMITLR